MPKGERAGVLTLGAVLAGKSHPVHPAPILRGVFVLENLACETLGQPPIRNVLTVNGNSIIPTTQGDSLLIEGTPPLLLDGAHTPRSLAAFAEHFRAIRAGRSATIVVGALIDKEWRDAFQPLADLPDVRWIATSNEEPRSIPAEELATRLQEIGISARPQTLENALDELIHHPPPLAALTGSFRLAGRVRELWKKRTPTD